MAVISLAYDLEQRMRIAFLRRLRAGTFITRARTINEPMEVSSRDSEWVAGLAYGLLGSLALKRC